MNGFMLFSSFTYDGILNNHYDQDQEHAIGVATLKPISGLLQISRLPSPKNFSNFYQLNC
jgi:hypothetical protein